MNEIALSGKLSGARYQEIGHTQKLAAVAWLWFREDSCVRFFVTETEAVEELKWFLEGACITIRGRIVLNPKNAAIEILANKIEEFSAPNHAMSRSARVADGAARKLFAEMSGAAGRGRLHRAPLTSGDAA